MLGLGFRKMTTTSHAHRDSCVTHSSNSTVAVIENTLPLPDLTPETLNSLTEA